MTKSTVATNFLLFFLMFLLSCSFNKEKIISQQASESSIKKPVDTASQNRLRKLTLTLQNADSILLVSHDRTYGPVDNATRDSLVEAKRLVENGKINRSVIRKTLLIEGSDKEQLISVLTADVYGNQIPLALCFDPHHALLVIKDEHVSCIEFCFTCTGVDSDKSLMFYEDFDEEKWSKIYDYINNRLPIKN